MADGAALTLFGVVVGWAATHIFSEARERRKEYRGQLEKVHELASKIEQAGCSFHRSPSHDAIKASDLVSQLAWLERSIVRIPIFEEARWTPALITLRQAVTLNNFDASTFKQQADHSEIIADITDATFGLEDELETQYLGRYPAKFPFFSIRIPG
ncbi:UNVERIFIED_ORG: hypothetical protein ABIC54_002172 [Burkholderia sp. 1263]